MLSRIERWSGGMIWTDRFYTAVWLGSCCIETPYRGRHLLLCTNSTTLNNGHNFVELQLAQRHLSRKSKRLDLPLFSGHLITSGILGIVLILTLGSLSCRIHTTVCVFPVLLHKLRPIRFLFLTLSYDSTNWVPREMGMYHSDISLFLLVGEDACPAHLCLAN